MLLENNLTGNNNDLIELLKNNNIEKNYVEYISNKLRDL